MEKTPAEDDGKSSALGVPGTYYCNQLARIVPTLATRTKYWPHSTSAQPLQEEQPSDTTFSFTAKVGSSHFSFIFHNFSYMKLKFIFEYLKPVNSLTKKSPFFRYQNFHQCLYTNCLVYQYCPRLMPYN